MQQPPPHDEFSGDEREPNALKEIVVTIVAALLLAFVVQQFLVKPYRIPSGSMERTLRCGDRVLVDRLSYRFTDPKRFDVVVFHPPAGINEHGRPDPLIVAGEGQMPGRAPDGTRELTPAHVNYIKRIVGMPGDQLEVRNHRAYVNGERLEEPYLPPLDDEQGITSDGEWGPASIPQGTYLMLGDNRNNSKDGRSFGFVPEEFLIGRAFMVYWPVSRIGALPERDAGGSAPREPDPRCLGEFVPVEEPVDDGDEAPDTDGDAAVDPNETEGEPVG